MTQLCIFLGLVDKCSSYICMHTIKVSRLVLSLVLVLFYTFDFLLRMTLNNCPWAGNCNFDQTMCGWINDRYNDDFDWIRNSGNTSTQGTGPSKDHTHGDATGKLHLVIFCTSSLQMLHMYAEQIDKIICISMCIGIMLV